MYLALDTETGGLGDKISILTAYFTILDKDFKIIKELDLKLMPNDGIYIVQGEGLRINKINLAEHDLFAQTYGKCGTLLYDFLNRYYNEVTKQDRLVSGITDEGVVIPVNCPITLEYERLIPIGHNVSMDIRKIKEFLISPANWEKYVSYRCLDTCSIAQFLRMNGKLPKDLACSTDSLITHFNIKVEGVLHEAKYDTLCGVEILKELNKLVQGV